MDLRSSHQFSLQCYLDARQDTGIPSKRYEDLESLVHHFRLTESGPSVGNPPAPGKFAFLSQAPSLLIVEDEAMITEFLKDELVNLGYPEGEIHIFPSGEEAIFYTQRHAVGIALVDIKLSTQLAVREIYTSGLQVIRAIKEASPGAKVILMSGFATYEMARGAMLELGASYYLKKPFRLTDVLSIVHWAVERLLGPEVKQIVSAGSTDRADRLPENILVVDDDRAVAEGIALTLCSFGYQAEAADGGKKALERMKASRFDAVLLDIRMPGMDGLEVLRRIRQEDHSPIVFILTAVGDEKVAKEAMTLGASDFLTKPCDISMLQINLEYAFAQRQAGGNA